MTIDNVRNPTLYEIKELTHDWGLVGEHDTVLTLFLAFFGGGTVIITGLSSGGKDANMNAAEYCCPDDMVAQVPTSLSKTALYERSDEFNSRPVHRHKDITALKDKDFLEDIWKRHGQGDSITHSWTEVVPERHEKSRTLEAPHCLVLFLASDNEQVSLNDYPEVRNRAIVIGIDDSRKLNKLVNTRQAQERAGIVEYRVSEQRTKEIREYVGSIPMHMYSDAGSGTFLNPVSEAIDNQNPLPQNFTEVRRDFPRLMDFIESVTLFHYDDRMEVPLKRLKETHERQAQMMNLLVTPADVWLGMRVFGEKMVLSAMNLRDKDFALLELLRGNYGSQYDVDTLAQMMKEKGWNITPNDVRRSLKNMHSKTYVRVDKTQTPHQWSAGEFAKQAKREVQMDWPTIIEDTRETVETYYPDEVGSEYISEFLEGEGLLVTHPFTGETINLTEQDANELEQTVEDAEAQEAEAVFDAEMYDDDDDDDDEPEAASPSQGTLT